jgi:2-polyprenyl-6-methoxyphenol hydroxylase-like FAD-dependent oxidoreductase
MSGIPGEADILVVGAGPTGLALATELKRLGADPLVIDRQLEGANTSRACVVHARTLEVLTPSGTTRDLLARGIQVPIFRIRDRDHPLMTVDFGQIESDYPFTLMIPQSDVEKCLLERFKDLGGSVIHESELVGFAAGPREVRARVRMGGIEKDVAARWLAGCDGMNSLVRTGSGIAFSGGEYEESFVLADVRMEWPISRQEVSLFYSPQGLVVVAPLPDDRFRIVATLDQAPMVPTVELMQSIIDARGPSTNPGRIHDIAWGSRFHIHHRVAQRLRKGRVLLCGDAAHVHSPAGGQGMNTGIQDAVSLAPILMDAEADDRGLDDWAAKSHEVAIEVVALTDRMTRIATMKSPAARALRNAAVSIVGHIPQVRSTIARTLAELDH